ncbi:hypothetical protein, partial [Yinghuangia sp. YIM S10712]|uniref:hypothetical protein n=1 Tax=Yinghuangia sp. YIM S10712 TaxID=3436930 RepID=UPI003F532A58
PPPAAVWVLVLTVVAVLTPPIQASAQTPARASSASVARLPADENDALEPRAQACRHQPDAFYVPKDPEGNWFWWYCRDSVGLFGDGFSPLGTFEGDFGGLWGNNKKVNQDQPDNWNEWMSKYATAGNLVDFTKLVDEPCETWNRAELDLEQPQCAKIKTLAARQSPCDQWWDLIKSVQGQPDVEPLDTARDGGLISICRGHQAHFQRAWAAPKIEDSKTYDRYDFSAPDEITKPMGQLVSIAQWVALVAGVLGVLFSAAKLAVAYQNGFGEAATGIVIVLGSVSLAMSALALASLFLVG